MQQAAVHAVARRQQESKTRTRGRNNISPSHSERQEHHEEEHEQQLRLHNSYKFDGEQSKVHFERRVKLGSVYAVRLRIVTEVLVVMIGLLLGCLAAAMNISISYIHRGGTPHG